MKTCRHLRCCILSVSGLVFAHQAAASGDIDPQFGDNGQVMIPRPDVSGLASTLVGDLDVLPDGRLLWVMEDGLGGAVVGRLLPNGAIDGGFGTEGRVVIGTCVERRPMRLVAMSDGGAVVWTGACLRRLDAAGAIDPVFGDATVFSPTGGLSGFVAAELLRDSDGRWLLAGMHSGQWRVHRFLADGGNDASFGADGSASPEVPATQEARELHAMALQPDGRIVLAGATRSGSKMHLALFRLDEDGQPDATFGSAGLAVTAPPTGFQSLIAQAIAIDGDGSLAIAGEGRNGGVSCCVLSARYDGHGDPVPDRLRIFELGPSVSLSPFGETAASVAILPHGKILIARNAFPFPGPENTRTRFTLIRLLADGTPDTAFDGDGWRSYIVVDPTPVGQTGAYVQMHATSYAAGEATMFGRTFFEDNGKDIGYVTFMRVRFDALFEHGFDP